MNEKFFRKGPLNAAKNRPSLPSEAELAGVPAADERKTVILDEDLDGVEFEDRVWLYWKRNRNFIVFTVTAAFAIVIGVQAWKMYRANASESLAAAYCAASSPEELAKFAADNSGTTLAAVALLQNADAAYKAGKYPDAEKLYSQAAGGLGGYPLAQRAEIGAAVSAISAGNAENGMAELEKIFKSAAKSAYSAQAGYLLGLAKAQSGKSDEAKAIFKELSGSEQNGIFAILAVQELSNLN